MTNNIKLFKPCELLLKSLKDRNYGVLVLNIPTEFLNQNLWKVWNEAKIRVLVDGGSESWVAWMNSPSKEKCALLLPNLVTGDFDSITAQTLESFKQNKDIQVIHTPDQDETDFTKALRELNSFNKNNNVQITEVYVLSDSGGRMDQIMANINSLFKAENILPNVKVFLLSPDSISWLLTPGAHSISIPQLLRDNKTWCGLIPIGSPAVVTTSGLKWNLNKTKMLFGKMVSTSNTYDGSPEVKVQTDSCILWTMCTYGLV